MKRNNTIEKVEHFLRHCGYVQIPHNDKTLHKFIVGIEHCGVPVVSEDTYDGLWVQDDGRVFAGKPFEWTDITPLVQGAMK